MCERYANECWISMLFVTQAIKEDVLINACCPGWVKTDMAGDVAPLTPDQGVETPILLPSPLLPPGSPTGEFWRDKKVVQWQLGLDQNLSSGIVAVSDNDGWLIP